MRTVSLRVLALVGLLILLSTAGFTQVVKPSSSYLDTLAFKDFALGVKSQPVAINDCINTLSNRAAWKSFQASYPNLEIYVDRYTGMPVLVNGTHLQWVQGDPFAVNQKTALVNRAKQFMLGHSGIFPGIAPGNLVLNEQRSGAFGEDGYLWFLDFDFVYQGVPIDGARLVFRMNHGNMVQFGVEGIIPFGDLIGDILDPYPSVTAEQALDIAFGYVGGIIAKTDTVLNPGTLKFIPYLTDADGNAVGAKFQYPLVWEVSFIRQEVTGTWTFWVDAHTGQVISFFDDNRYGIVKGGIYPVSQTVSTEVVRGLPFANVASGVYANWAGRYDSPTSGTATSSLAGKYVKIADSCGSISLSATAPGDLNFSSSSGTDCTTPGVGGSGNTHAARSCYFHVTNAKYKAMQWLPSNTWLTGQLTSNVNLNQTCNAYWNGSSINFFRSGGGCGNTGEIASIFVHEFAHGLDSNDGGSSSDMSTGEVYGDGFGLLVTHNSCGGPGFLSSNCSGYGDSCTNCTGVREADYAKHSTGNPHTIAQTMGTTGFKCPTSSSYAGPCGREGHCEAIPGIETMWDLANRDIGPLVGDTTTGWFILDRLFFLSRATSGSMYTCNTSTKTGASCSASNWLQSFLVVDDNDGNLTNGTPHAGAIKAAFARHGMDCTSTVGTNSTTCGTIGKPVVTATPGNNSIGLSWAATTGAAKYYVLRNDIGCDAGYIKIAETTSTTYTDSQVYNGMTYYYRVVTVGTSASCLSNLSDCKTATPVAGATYAISGTVSGATAAGVTVSCSGGSATTASDGTYTISGLANGTYTVTPSKSGYTFSPTSLSVTISGANQTGKNFTAGTVPTYSVSGTVSGAVSAGVTMTLTGAASATVTTATGGTYTFSGLANGSYTITPSMSGYSFSPTSTAVTISSANQTGKNFTATASPNLTAAFNTTYQAPACTANGVSCDTGASLVHCMAASGETNAPNTVNDSCADGTSGSCSSDESVEQLAIAATNGSSYLAVGTPVTITAKFYCYSATQDYVAVYYASTVPASGAPTWTSLGTSACGGTGVVTKTYPTTLAGSAGMQAVRAEIAYNAAITSACQSGNYNDRDDLVFNVTGGTATYSISGTVSGAVTSGVTMTLSGAASATTTTATGGTYTFSGLANGSYTVTPSLSGYSFSPTSTAVTISGANQTGKNFTSTSTATYSISGTVSGAVASGVTMTLSGAASATTTTATGGTYTFSGLANGTYTVTPSLSGYTFSPTSTSVTVSGANQTGKNFTSTSSGGSTTVFTQDFSTVTAPALPSGWTTLVTTGNAWKTSTSGCTGSALMYPYHSTAVANSWAFTPGFTLSSGVTYTLTFNQKVQSATYPEKMEVKAGTAATAAGQTIAIWSSTSLTNTTCTARTATFTVPSTGTYYLGWHCTSAADMYNLFVDDILLTGGGTAPTTYSISGAVTGAVTASVTMTLTGASSSSTTTATNGSYTFSGLANGSYTVTPSRSGYTFSPASSAVSVSGANKTGINFTSTATGGSTTLFTNGFESAWTQTDTSGTAGTWSTLASGTYPTCSKHGGSYMAKFNSYNAASGSATRYYQPSSFAIGSAFTSVTLTFWMYHDTGYSSNADKIQPQVSTNGTTWTAVGSAINRYDGSTGWKQHTVSLLTYKGSTIYLGFLATSAYGNNIYLDDVTVTAQ